jgi:hypothetical protein
VAIVLVVILLIVFLLAMIGSITGLTRLKRKQGELPSSNEGWRDHSVAKFVSPAEVIYGDSRRFARNTYGIEIFDDLVQIVFQPKIGSLSPVRLFYPQWYVPRQSITGVRPTSQKFMYDKKPREAVNIEFNDQSGHRKYLVVGTEDPAGLLSILAS